MDCDFYGKSSSGTEPHQISHAITTAAMKVHTALGPGLLENTYTHCLHHELLKSGFKAEMQVALPVIYDGARLDLGYRIDLLVERSVVVELNLSKPFTQSIKRKSFPI